MRKRSRINLDRLELTYTASDEVRTYLSDKNVQRYELESVTLIREQSRLYENEFSIIMQDYDEELGAFDCCIGHLHFGSPNPHRQHVYIVYENQALYNTVFVAIRYYLEDVLGLTFRQVSKIDIAVDFNFCIVRRFYQLYKNSEYDLIINGKKIEGVEQKVADVLHITGNTTRKRPMANPMPVVKNSGGSLSLRLYNKTREIEEESHKDYITDAVGFARMYRIEVSCGNHKALKPSLNRLEMSETDLYMGLQDEGTLSRLFRALLDRLIRVQKGRRSYSLMDILLDEKRWHPQATC